MSVKKNLIGEMIPGILMMVLVLAGVASGETSHPQSVAQEPAVDLTKVEVQLREVAGDLAIQVISGASSVLSSQADNSSLCGDDDCSGSREGLGRSF